MATLTAKQFDVDGLDTTYASAAGGGDVVANSGKTVLHVKNGDASSKTVTVTAQTTSATIVNYGDATFSDSVVAIPAGEERFIGPFPTSVFNNSSDQIEISYSAVTSVTIAALKWA